MPDVAGGGHVGFALETTHGTYIAPTDFAPIESETLHEVRSDPWRSPLLGRAVTTGKVGGREHVEGEIVMEALPQVMAYFLAASRWGNNITKAGTASPWTYTANDDGAAHVKTNFRSLTIVIDRAGIGFAYLGCQVTSQRFYFDDGILKVAYGIIGREQSEDYSPGAVTEPTETPFAADEVAITIAAGARVDIESLEITLEDNGEAKFNLSGASGADYVKFGEFSGEADLDIDFESKADYAIWVARTVQELKLTCTKGANQIAVIELHGALYDTFEVALDGLGDQVMASAKMMAAYVAGGDTAAAEIALTTTEDITLA